MGSRRRGESRICPNPGMFKNVRVSLFPRNFWSELVRYCDSELSRTQSLLAYKLLLLNCWTFSSEQRLVEDISFSIVSFLNLIANSKKTSYTMHFVRSVSASLSLPLHESQFYSQIYKVKFRQMKVRNINNEKSLDTFKLISTSLLCKFPLNLVFEISSVRHNFMARGNLAAFFTFYDSSLSELLHLSGYWTSKWRQRHY